MFHLKQWINWRLEPRAGQSKPAKVPCIVGGGPIDPHDPKYWLDYQTAKALDPEHVGFVLTANDPYFCADLDHCREGDGWNALAGGVCALFPGAYMEVSHSGDGLHIIGRGRVPEGYKTRGPGVECYQNARFIAITGAGAQGNPDVDCTAGLAQFAPLHLKPTGAPDDHGDFPWTTEAIEGAKVIEDDRELLHRMLTAKHSAGMIWGDKASPADLWNRNVEALALAFPSTDPKKPFGQSDADGSLAAHLAFWTGKNCERIERLMRASALAREKWDKHGSYLRNTITGACAKVERVYTGPKPKPGAADVPQSALPLLTIEQQHEHFAGCTYIASLHRVLTPVGTLLKPDPFRVMYGGFEFELSPWGGRPTKSAWEAFTESRGARFPKVDEVCFRPELAPGTVVSEEGIRLVNTYVPAVVSTSFGDVSRWLRQLRLMLPDERDYTILLSYLAALKQYPGRKFFWCPLIQGAPGNGKTALTDAAAHAVGQRYTHKPSAKELADSGSKFTGWLDRKLLVVIEEIHVSDRRELIDALKPLITDRRVEIQKKGADQVTGDNRANFLLTTNHRDAITKTANDRRYAIFYTAQQTYDDCLRDGMTDDYMHDFYNWLNGGGYADVTGYLSKYQIPDEFNPAGRCNRAPVTSTTAEAIVESMGVVEQHVCDAIDEQRPGFAGGWISSVRLNDLLQEIRRPMAPRKIGELMATLGFEPRGKATTMIFQEGNRRPTLYVKRKSIASQHPNPTAAYMAAQGYAAVGQAAVG